MIEYLYIKNFQKHSSLKLQFDGGLNSIVGPTDSGKSSVIRALTWLFTNRPLGDGFRKYDTKETTVEVGIDGRVLRRVKSSTANYYELDGKKFEAMSGKVPDQIMALLNLSEVNIHTQHEPHFLLSETSGEVGRFINKIVNLSVMDSSMKLAASELKTTKTEKVRAEIEIKRIDSELIKFAWTDSFDTKLTKVEVENKKFEDELASYETLLQLTEEALEINEQLKEAATYTPLAKRLEKLSLRYKEYKEFSDKVATLIDLVEEVTDIEEELKDCKKYIKFADKINKYQASSEQLLQQLFSFNTLDNLVNDYLEETEELKQHKQQLSKLEKQLTEAIGDVCPLCDQEIKQCKSKHP